MKYNPIFTTEMEIDMNKKTKNRINPSGELVSAETAALLIGVNTKTLKKWRESSPIQLPFTLVSGLPLYYENDLRDFLIRLDWCQTVTNPRGFRVNCHQLTRH
jgi:hypothetical protein